MLEAINVLKGVGWILTAVPCFKLSNHLTRSSGLKTSCRRIRGRRACLRWGRLYLHIRAYNHNPFRHNLLYPISGYLLHHQLPQKP